MNAIVVLTVALGLNSSASCSSIPSPESRTAIFPSEVPTPREDLTRGTLSNCQVTEVGDINGDGVSDIAVLVRGSKGVGCVAIIDISKKTLLRVHSLSATTSVLAPLVVKIDDLDGDSVGDYCFAESTGVTIYSGLRGTSIKRFTPSTDSLTNFGAFIGGGADCDGDGINDLAIGSFNIAPPFASALEVYSSLSGKRIANIYEASSPIDIQGMEGFGLVTTLIDDVDGDHRADVLIGCPNKTNPDMMPVPSAQPFLESQTHGSFTDYCTPGCLECFSGRTGKLIYRKWGQSCHGSFGGIFALIDDYTGDKVQDVIVVASPRHFELLSGADGSTVSTVPAELAGGTDGFCASIGAFEEETGKSIGDVIATLQHQPIGGPTMYDIRQFGVRHSSAMRTLESDLKGPVSVCALRGNSHDVEQRVVRVACTQQASDGKLSLSIAIINVKSGDLAHVFAMTL